jgi:hypothetical protein
MERVLSDGVTRSQAQCLIDPTTIRENLTYSTSMLSLHGLASSRMRRQRSASFTVSVSVPAPEAINRGSCVELCPPRRTRSATRSTAKSALGNQRKTRWHWYPAPIRARILGPKDRLASVVSKPKLRRPEASSSSRRSTARPAVTPAVSERGMPRANASASTYSDTRREPTSKRAAIVDLPAPLGPDNTTTEGRASGT